VHLTSWGQTTGVAATRRRLPRRWAVAAVAIGLLLVFLLDRATDVAPVQHLYYAPIILAAVSFGRRGGLAAALAAIVLYHLANPSIISFPYAQGDIVQVTLFVAVGLITAKLTTDGRRLRVLAMTDDLTGLHNLRSFEEQLKGTIADAAVTGTPLSLLVLDVDRLKSLNDRYGHLTGAEAVRTVGRLIATGAAPGAVACRYGGDEFVIALPRCAEPEALLAANCLRESVSAAAPVLAGRPFPPGTLSISVGIACTSFDTADAGAMRFDDPDKTGDTLFRAADAALYAAKAGGRNRVVMAQAMEPPDAVPLGRIGGK